MEIWRGGEAWSLRREVSSFSCEEGDVDVIACGNLAHEVRETEVEVLGQGIEFLGEVESDDGDLAAGLEGYLVVRCGHAGSDLGSSDGDGWFGFRLETGGVKFEKFWRRACLNSYVHEG